MIVMQLLKSIKMLLKSKSQTQMQSKWLKNSKDLLNKKNNSQFEILKTINVRLKQENSK